MLDTLKTAVTPLQQSRSHIRGKKLTTGVLPQFVLPQVAALAVPTALNCCTVNWEVIGEYNRATPTPVAELQSPRPAFRLAAPETPIPPTHAVTT